MRIVKPIKTLLRLCQTRVRKCKVKNISVMGIIITISITIAMLSLTYYLDQAELAKAYPFPCHKGQILVYSEFWGRWSCKNEIH